MATFFIYCTYQWTTSTTAVTTISAEVLDFFDETDMPNPFQLVGFKKSIKEMGFPPNRARARVLVGLVYLIIAIVGDIVDCACTTVRTHIGCDLHDAIGFFLKFISWRLYNCKLYLWARWVCRIRIRSQKLLKLIGRSSIMVLPILSKYSTFSTIRTHRSTRRNYNAGLAAPTARVVLRRRGGQA